MMAGAIGVRPSHRRKAWATTGRAVTIAAGTVCLLLTMVLPSPAQSPDLATLKTDVAALKTELETVKRELQQIKTLLLGRAGAPSNEFRSVTLSIGDGPFKGAANAHLTLVEFTDYQCPFCARHHHETMPRLLEAYVKTGKLKYVVRDFPLESIHPAAAKAAEAPHCAADGGKYWEMHEYLFANPKALTPDDLVTHAQMLGLDAQAFKRCLETGKYAPRVRQAQAEGERVGVQGTPSFFFGLTEPNNGQITAVAAIRGAHPFARFEEVIEKLLSTKQK
jgi:protein-disulfide isomerase